MVSPLKKKIFLGLAVICYVFILGGSLLSTISFYEYWPFTYYPMYARSPQSMTWQWFRLIGEKSDGSEVELNKHEYTKPYDYVKFSYVAQLNYRNKNDDMNLVLLKTIHTISLRKPEHVVFAQFKKIKIQQIVWKSTIEHFNPDLIASKKEISCYDIEKQTACE